jgi:hypothetical protein
MIQRSQVPLALLTVLAVLTAGFATLALLTSPRAADLTVQNGTAETYASSSFSLTLTSTVSSGPGSGVLSQVRLVTYKAPDHMVAYQVTPEKKLLGSLNAAAIAKVLTGYAAVTSGATPWQSDGSHFTRTESLVTFSARVSHQPSAQGKVYETAVVHSGYLVYVNLHVVVPNQTTAGGQQAPGGVVGEIFHVLKINGTPTPALTP